jgi:hypothetical protein
LLLQEPLLLLLFIGSKMHSIATFAALAGCLFSTSIASPTPVQDADEIERRGLLRSLGGVLGNVIDPINKILDGKTDSKDPYGDVLKIMKPVTATTRPSDTQQAYATVSSVFAASPTPKNIIDAAARLVAQGLTKDNVESGLDFIGGVLEGENSEYNVNLKNPTPAAFPKAGPSDAPYSLSEAALRAVIHIPDSFQYGRAGAPQPIILVPGTGNTGYITFSGNMIPLIQESKVADPVWLNIPGYLLNDAQVNAEYVAYAINYIYGISNQRQVAIGAWSQGNIDAQWAYKYWPSTRDRVTDHVGFSPDYHGTVLANVIEIPGEPLPPSVLQQEYNAKFITTLRNKGGDSSYVPTTNIFSATDEVVQPQFGDNASGSLLDARGAGASNNEVQVVCKGELAGSLYTHEGVLYNPLSFALLKDALANNGTGQPSRLNLQSVCNDYLTPELDLADFLLTENSILVAGLAILTYPDKVNEEPPIKPYAAS